MSTKKIFIKNIFTVLILIALPVSSAYAKDKDLDGLLNGVYAQNEQWACIASEPPLAFDGNHWTEHVTAAGEIIYHGDGTATANGRVSLVNNTNPFGDIATYTCHWIVDVLDNWTFELNGHCEVTSVNGDNPPTVFITKQKWFGRISNKGETLLVERHDVPAPENFEGVSSDNINTNDLIEKICGKTGVQIKLR
jgi:hypothetical protein